LKNLVYISDFFKEQILGGAELNDSVLLEEVLKEFEITKIQSHNVKVSFLKKVKNSLFIISNFINLDIFAKKFIIDNCRYIIYEHDHKYLKSRDPSHYKNFIAPRSEIINFDFYKNAKAIICQTRFHAGIVNSNLHLDNIQNLSGNLWSTEILEMIKKLSNRKKNKKCFILNSSILHKNTSDAIRYCKYKNLQYELVGNLPYSLFLEKLAEFERFVFFPKTPETLSRVVVEARMMNVEVVTNNLVGAAKEDWFKFKGEKLIDIMNKKQIEIKRIIKNLE